MNRKMPMTAPMMAGTFQLVFELVLPPGAMLFVPLADAEAWALNIPNFNQLYARLKVIGQASLPIG
jgi:hypothetical protein